MSGRVRRTVGTAVLACAGAAVVVAGGLATPGAARAQDEDQKVSAEFSYLCTGQDAEWRVPLRVTATFPARGAVGEPVLPTAVEVALTVPPEALAGLVAAGAAEATSVMRLDTRVGQGETVANASWAAVGDEPVPVVAGEPVVLTGVATPEPITTGTPGDLVFSVAGMVATISTRTEEGVPTEPPNAALTCLPDSEQLVFATVPVDDRAKEPGAPPAMGKLPGIAVGPDGDDAVTATDAGEVPPECHPIAAPPNSPLFQSYCAKLTGYTNVNKLKASVLQPSGLVNISAGNFIRNCDGIRGKLCSYNRVEPNFNDEPSLPPAPASFFAFGVIPVEGKVQLTQIGSGEVFIWSQGADGLATATLTMSARLFDTEVNGVPLDVGPDCRTETPIAITLTAKPGRPPDGYSITEGGVLSGMVTIPPFAGCGVTEDLDPVITGLVSGPDNYVRMTQGGICSLSNGVVCPPVDPVPSG